MLRARFAALLGLACLPGWAAEGPGQSARADSRLGPVEATVRIEPPEVRVGDILTLRLEVRAEPGVELLLPAFGESLERFAIVDFAPRERIDEQGRTVATQIYRLHTSISGTFSIPPLIVEFVDRRPGRPDGPGGADTFELLTEPLAFEVRSVVPTDATSELSPPLGPLPVPGARPGAARLAILAAALVLAALLAAAAVARRRRRPGPAANAYQVASRRLASLARAPRPAADDGPAMDRFFVELSDIVRRYLEERYHLRAPERTTEEFLEDAAARPELTPRLRSFLADFLYRADGVKFAHRRPGAEDVESTLSAVARFLEDSRPAETSGA